MHGVECDGCDRRLMYKGLITIPQTETWPNKQVNDNQEPVAIPQTKTCT
jgi:hypothetical protein